MYIKKMILEMNVGTEFKDAIEYAVNTLTDPKYAGLEEVRFKFNDVFWTISKKEGAT